MTTHGLLVAQKHTIVAKVTIAPGASARRHTHLSEEISYFIEGQGEIHIDGQPPLHIKAGDGYVAPAGAIHDAHKTGCCLLPTITDWKRKLHDND
jgi:quercetin dioxygenase-like cupin family protein